MKKAKPIFVILIMMLICCSYSIGQSSSMIGVKASVYPTSQISDGTIVYLGDIKIDPINISLVEFQCDLISSCRLYPAGQDDIKTGASVYPTDQVSDGTMVYLDRVESGATVTLTRDGLFYDKELTIIE